MHRVKSLKVLFLVVLSLTFSKSVFAVFPSNRSSFLGCDSNFEKSASEEEVLKFREYILSELDFPGTKIDVLTTPDSPATTETLTFIIDHSEGFQNMDASWVWRRNLVHKTIHALISKDHKLRIQLLEIPATTHHGAQMPDIATRLTLYSYGKDQVMQTISRNENLWDVLDKSYAVFAVTKFSLTYPLLARYPRNTEGSPSLFTVADLSRNTFKAISEVDLEKKKERLEKLENTLQGAQFIRYTFDVDGKVFTFTGDVREQQICTELIRKHGDGANLGSGEVYTTTRSSLNLDNPTLTKGFLPVQLYGEVVLLVINNNKVFQIVGDPISQAYQELNNFFETDPGRRNIAELGFGVLDELGLDAIGDHPSQFAGFNEKLGIHFAFGSNIGLGSGDWGINQYKDPKNSIHVDYVYTEQLQDQIRILKAEVIKTSSPDDTGIIFYQNGKYIFSVE